MEIISDQNLRSYFLGTLAVEDAERLEEQCAADAELTEQAHLVESELADDYLRGGLCAGERRLFEENYLITEARREKLRLAEILWKVANENQKPAEASAPALWQTIFANYRVLSFGGLAAAIIFAVFGLVWLNLDKNPETAQKKTISQTSNSNALNQIGEVTQNLNAINQLPNINSANYNSQKNGAGKVPKPSVTPEIKATPEPFEPPAPTLATFTLLPGTLRGEGEQFIKISPKTEKIDLSLVLPKDTAKYQIYRAVVQTADGETIIKLPNLKTPKIFLPAKKLENQTYLVLLEGQNSPDQSAESVAEYVFRVRR